MSETSYLLLKDPQVRELPRVAPPDFDAAAEHRAEPARWGTWRKHGSEYQGVAIDAA